MYVRGSKVGIILQYGTLAARHIFTYYALPEYCQANVWLKVYECVVLQSYAIRLIQCFVNFPWILTSLT